MSRRFRTLGANTPAEFGHVQNELSEGVVQTPGSRFTDTICHHVFALQGYPAYVEVANDHGCSFRRLWLAQGKQVEVYVPRGGETGPEYRDGRTDMNGFQVVFVTRCRFMRKDSR